MSDGSIIVTCCAILFASGMWAGNVATVAFNPDNLPAYQDSLRISHYDRHTGKRILDSVEFRGDTLIIHRKDK